MADQKTDYVYRRLDQLQTNATNSPALEQGGMGMQRMPIPAGYQLAPH